MSNRYLVICSVVERNIDGHQKRELENRISALYKMHIGKFSKPTVVWVEIPASQAYLDGKASKASTVLTSVPNELEPCHRSDFLYDIRDLWMSVTHCARNELVISAPDQTLAKQFLGANRERVGVFHRPVMTLKLIYRALSSKLLRGRIETSINL